MLLNVEREYGVSKLKNCSNEKKHGKLLPFSRYISDPNQ